MHLYSNKVLSSSGIPAQILKIFSIPFFYLVKELTVGICLDVTGALHKYPSVLKTVWNL
jgi:hypothetical protein